MTLEHFKCPFCKSGHRIDSKELELDIDKLFNNVVEIKNDVDLNGCKFSPFKTLKHIGGDLYCAYADVRSLGSLEKVDGLIMADGASFEDLGSLTESDSLSLQGAKSLKTLSGFKKAEYINICYTKISDVSGIEECDEMAAQKCPIPQEQKDRMIKLTNGNCKFN